MSTLARSTVAASYTSKQWSHPREQEYLLTDHCAPLLYYAIRIRPPRLHVNGSASCMSCAVKQVSFMSMNMDYLVLVQAERGSD